MDWTIRNLNILLCFVADRGGNRGNYGNFSSEEGNREWTARGNRGNNGGFGGRPRQERRSFTEDLPNPTPGYIFVYKIIKATSVARGSVV